MKFMARRHEGQWFRVLALAGIFIGGCGSAPVGATPASSAGETSLATSLPGPSPQIPNTQKAIKFHPGHYIELDPGSGGGGLPGWIATIGSLQGAAGVKGVMLIQPWSNLEFAEGVYSQGAGATAQGFAMIDQLLAACRSAGLQFMLGVEDRSFGAAKNYSTPSSFGQLPPYFDTLVTSTGAPAYIDAPAGTTWSGSLQMIAKLWDPVVMNRYIALTKVYGARYDANPNFEMWATSETAIGVPSGDAGFSEEAYVEQLERWIPQARQAFQTSGLRISANFLSTPVQFTELFEAAQPYAIGMGGPDVKVDFSTFPGTSNLVFSGYEGGEDYRNVLPWISEVQTPDESGIWTPAQIYDYALDGNIATGGAMHSNYFIWAFDASWEGAKAFTNAQILAFVQSVNGVVNATPPSTYMR